MIIDAKNAVMGRVASTAAKTLLNGERVIIINAEKSLITGSPKVARDKYTRIHQIGSPQHGPFLQKAPDRMLRRVVRGMMPYKKSSGKEAFKRLRVYIGTPVDFNEIKGDEKIVEMQKNINANYIHLGDVSKSLGWRE